MTGPFDSAPPPELPILFRDDHLVITSKPSGMLVHRSEKSPDRVVLLQTLAAQTDAYLYPVQRLDRGTSGLIAFGLSSKDAGKLQKALTDPAAVKEYLALCRWPQHTFPLEDRWEIDRPLRDDSGGPKSARTSCEVVEHIGHFAVVRARIHTGRYQQIRRHLNHAARHVLGDTTHGKGRINQTFRKRFGLDRLFLHAHRLQFTHPVTQETVELVDPLPAELEAVLAKLRVAGAVKAADPENEVERDPNDDSVGPGLGDR